MANELNPSFYCPISTEIMVDPVIDREGNTYERKQIEEWVKLHHTSPITRNPLTLNDLAPNRALKEAIDEALTQQNPVEVKSIDINDISYENIDSLQESSPISLLTYKQIVSDTDVSSNQQIVNVNVSAINLDRKKRVPSDVVVVIDVSGSMGVNATVPGVEDCYLTILDIVKHAVKTIIHTLDDHDRLAIVQFSNTASVILNFSSMNAAGKKRAEEMLKTLQPDGMTNIWDALNVSLNLVKESKAMNSLTTKNSSILLLTDGEPNINPPRGIIPMLQRYKETNGEKFPGFINTFGFGYSLDSKLLYDIASMGNGMYAFIPDSGFVGTAFVNALANTLVTIAEDSLLEIVPSPNVNLLSDRVIVLGSIQAGQSKDIIIKLSTPIDYQNELFESNLIYNSFDNNNKTTRNTVTSCTASFKTIDREDEEVIVKSHYYRIELINLLNEFVVNDSTNYNDERLLVITNKSKLIINDIKLYIDSKKSIVKVVQSIAYKRIQGLLADLEGEITKALSRLDWFLKWGRHYLLSLKRAHELQQCNNFKDPGIQQYGGDIFRKVRDFADDKFCQLPPPTATAPKYDNYGGYSAVAPTAAAIQMSTFNDRDAPCFHESCLIQLLDGSTKVLSLVNSGDVLMGGSIVECVLRTKCYDNQISLVSLEDSKLLVTPWHPVYQDNDWRFPYDISNGLVKSYKCEYVYSFLVRKHTNKSIEYNDHIVINGVKCLALAHGILNHPVATHPFFGSINIVQSLMKCTGWGSGMVTLDQNQGPCVRRDVKTGLVCDIIEHTNDFSDSNIMNYI